MKILLFISLLFLLACSSTSKENKSDKKEETFLPNLSIGDNKSESETLLIELGYEKVGDLFHMKKGNLDFTIKISGQKSINTLKTEIYGSFEDLKTFLKHLINVYKLQHLDFQGKNDYYVVRYKHGKYLCLAELTMWKDKIEIIHREQH